MKTSPKIWLFNWASHLHFIICCIAVVKLLLTSFFVYCGWKDLTLLARRQLKIWLFNWSSHLHFTTTSAPRHSAKVSDVADSLRPDNLFEQLPSVLRWARFLPPFPLRILPYIPVRPDIRCSWKYTAHLLQLLFSQIKESRWQILNFEVMKGVHRVWPCSSLSAKVWTKGSGEDGIEIRLITWTPEPKERSSYLNKRESGTLQVEKKTRFWG